MGYFDFVAPDLEGEPTYGDTPSYGKKVRRVGEDFSRTGEPNYQGDDAFVPPSMPEDNYPMGEESTVTRRKFSEDESSVVKKEQTAVKNAKDILERNTRGMASEYGNPQFHQLLDALNKGMLNPSQLADDVQTLLKTGNKLRPETVQALSSVANELKQAQAARQSLEARRSGIVPAQQTSSDVFEGQSQEAFDQAKKLREEAQSLGVLGGAQAKLNQAKNLEAQAASLKQRAEEARQAQQQQQQDQSLQTTTEEQPNLDLKGDIDSNIKAAGRNPRDFRLAMVAAARILEEKTGLDTMALKDRVPFQRALLSALQIFDPAGIIASQLAQDMQPSAPPPSQGGGDQSSGNQTTGTKGTSTVPEVSQEEDQHTQNIRRMQADRRALYYELGQTPELQSWLGVLTFVFLSVITRSPAVAASILGISRRQGNLKMQLDLIEKEMHEEGDMLRNAQKRTEFNRKLAAEHSLRRSDKAEDFQLELQKMYLQHKLILEREAKRDPANKNAYKQLENSFVRQKQFYDKAQHKKDEAQRILSNDFSDEALKAQAQKDFNAAQKEMNFYATRLRDLDAEIRRQGGVQFQDEVPVEENNQ